MGSRELPDFEYSLRLGQGSLDAAELAECHGVLCGLLTVSRQAGAEDFFRELRELRLLDQPREAIRATLEDLFQATEAQLEDEEMGFRLWLPNDREPLEERTEALARWCTGLLAGLASQGDLDSLSGEAGEAVRDLEQIARAGLSVGGEADNEAMEEEERAFAEVSEYVRVVAMMLREDFRGPGQDEAVH